MSRNPAYGGVDPLAPRTFRCGRCGADFTYNERGTAVHLKVPLFRHQPVPPPAPTEAQQDRAQHVRDLPEPHEVGCPCGFDHRDDGTLGEDTL